jgi:hypothetical protein
LADVEDERCGERRQEVALPHPQRALRHEAMPANTIAASL